MKRILPTLAFIILGFTVVACADTTGPQKGCGVTGGSQTCYPK